MRNRLSRSSVQRRERGCRWIDTRPLGPIDQRTVLWEPVSSCGVRVVGSGSPFLRPTRCKCRPDLRFAIPRSRSVVCRASRLAVVDLAAETLDPAHDCIEQTRCAANALFAYVGFDHGRITRQPGRDTANLMSAIIVIELPSTQGVTGRGHNGPCPSNDIRRPAVCRVARASQEGAARQRRVRAWADPMWSASHRLRL